MPRIQRRVVTRGNKAVQWSGLKELEANVNKLLLELGGSQGRAVGEEVKKILMTGALTVADEAKDLVPVRKGKLKSAIFAAYGKKDKPDVLVGVNTRKAVKTNKAGKTKTYAGVIEFGDDKHQAQPFMRPAINATRGKVIAIVAEGLKKLIEKTLP